MTAIMSAVTDFRQCSRPGCGNPAVSTLRYNYRASRATVTVLGPGGDPHSWDLCGRHVARLTVPEGWDLVREDGGDSGLLGGPSNSGIPAVVGTPGVSNALGGAVSDSSDFTDEEMQILAEALEAVEDVDSPRAKESTGVHPPEPASKIVRREDLPRPSGRHPSRGNLPRRAPSRHLHAVRDAEGT